MSVFALGRLKNHNIPHLHPNFTMFMPLSRPQLKISAFSGKFNVCSKCVLLSWIKICRDFTLQTQDFYSEIKELTQILLRISEEKLGGWSLWYWLQPTKKQGVCYEKVSTKGILLPLTPFVPVPVFNSPQPQPCTFMAVIHQKIVCLKKLD